MAKKEIIYQGLADLTVQIDDFSLSSQDYFRIAKLPTEFTAGLNTFRFKGNATLFAENTPVYIEILDANGDPIYYEIGLDLESAEQAAIITVFINEDTAPGVGDIILCSTANYDVYSTRLDTSQINLRWSTQIYIDPSKRNETEIIFDTLPEINVFPSTGAYLNNQYIGGSAFTTESYYNLIYYYQNNTPLLVTSSLTPTGFRTDALNANAYTIINASSLSNPTPDTVNYKTTDSTTIAVTQFSGSGIVFLDTPISYQVNDSNELFTPSYAFIESASISFSVSPSGSAKLTENTNNLVNVYFSNLQPQTGTVAKIKSYYRSAGIGEYILSNETDITDQETEFGFNVNVVTASFFLPTVQRNDRLDFKFEFVNPAGSTSKQVVESLNNLFLGGNTYIGGDDNLLTGSLYVAGSTGTGVHISGKGSSAMVRSIGYTGFQNAITPGGTGGFVLYSGSIQSILGSIESYSGVGLELVANSQSYFKYATSGSGTLDIKTNSFFLGNTSQYISGSNGNLRIKSTGLDINNGVISSSYLNVTAPAITTGSITYDAFTVIDTSTRIVDAKNIARTISYTNYTTSSGAWSTSLNSGWQNLDTYWVRILGGESNLILSISGRVTQNPTSGSSYVFIRLGIASASLSSDSNSINYASSSLNLSTFTYSSRSAVASRSPSLFGGGETTYIYSLPNASKYEGKRCAIVLEYLPYNTSTATPGGLGEVGYWTLDISSPGPSVSSVSAPFGGGV